MVCKNNLIFSNNKIFLEILELQKISPPKTYFIVSNFRENFSFLLANLHLRRYWRVSLLDAIGLLSNPDILLCF